jgi:electron transport complex protein RnfB
MHTVIVAECTGCDLCVEPCPVDCIEMRPLAQTLADWRWDAPHSPGESLRGLRSRDILASDRSSSRANRVA